MESLNKYRIVMNDGDVIVCISPVEIGHRACTVCLVSHIAMKLPRQLEWNPENERFVNDKEANAMLQRKQRAPYGTSNIKF